MNKIYCCIRTWLSSLLAPRFLQLSDVYRTCSSIIVCSNLGPDIANSRGIWFRDQTVARLGACIVRLFSASEAYSCRGLSPTPMLSMATSFVLDTLGLTEGGFGSFACSCVCPLVCPWLSRWDIEVRENRRRDGVRLAAQRAPDRTAGSMVDMFHSLGPQRCRAEQSERQASTSQLIDFKQWSAKTNRSAVNFLPEA